MGIFLSVLSSIVLYFLSSVKGHIITYCTWCGEIDNLNITNEGPGSFSYTYENKDGSRDSRRKDNPYAAYYLQDFTCEQCGAKSRVQRGWGEEPDKNGKIYRINLTSDGKGERSAKNFLA